jgi:hypothetical protein
VSKSICHFGIAPLATEMIGKQIRQTNGKFVFNQVFGVTPILCGVTWYLLKNNTELKINIEQVHLLWALYFMKNYERRGATACF